jgi:hypothetical protein
MSPPEDSGQDPPDVCIYHWNIFVKDERCNRIRRVLANSRQCEEDVRIVGDSSTALLDNRSSKPLQSQSTCIVTKPRPLADDTACPCSSKRHKRGKTPKEFFVLRDYTARLSLLQHGLRDQNLVRIPCLSPREWPFSSGVPTKNGALKRQLVATAQEWKRVLLHAREAEMLRGPTDSVTSTIFL